MFGSPDDRGRLGKGRSSAPLAIAGETPGWSDDRCLAARATSLDLRPVPGHDESRLPKGPAPVTPAARFQGRPSHSVSSRNPPMFARVALMILPAIALLCLNRAVTADEPAEKWTSVLDFQVKDIDGKPVDLSRYKGEVLLVVNTASQCGYTPQYEG